MKTFFIIAFASLSLGVNAQNEIVKLFYENKIQGPGSIIYANNTAYCPVTVTIEFELENMKFSNRAQKVFVVPAKIDRFMIGEVDPSNPRERFRYSYRFKYNYGDVTHRTADTSFLYDLPYAKDKTFRVFQGYNGSFSHRNEKALDFTMPEGTEIFAAREGVVVKLVQENNQSCLEEDCKKYNNYVLIYHADGSFAEYVHIRFNGATVKVGDQVKKGDLIAYSGNTGWSSGPHLHFVCFLPEMEKRRSIPTKFRINDGSQVANPLLEQQSYTKGY